MLPPRELNPFDMPGSIADLKHRSFPEERDAVLSALQERITELEARNMYLQSLVVELLDKNEQLRRKTETQEKSLGQA